jgi:hypothetical protein
MVAIQTDFNGCKFRSRLEARYAVLLHNCGVSYQYEREGFDVGRRYLPDFWLPALRLHVEIKGWTVTAAELDLCQALADETRCDVVIACGDPGHGTILYRLMPDASGTLIGQLPAFLMQWVPPDTVLNAIAVAHSARFEFGETPKIVPFARAARSLPQANAAC